MPYLSQNDLVAYALEPGLIPAHRFLTHEAPAREAARLNGVQYIVGTPSATPVLRPLGYTDARREYEM